MSRIDDLERLHGLHASGALSDDEYQDQKASILADELATGHAQPRRRARTAVIVGAAAAIALIGAVAAGETGIIQWRSDANTSVTTASTALPPANTVPATSVPPPPQQQSQTAGNGVPAGSQTARDQLLKMLSKDASRNAPPSNDSDLYEVTRRRLLATGLSPAPIPRGANGPCGVDGEDEICRLYPETVDCAGMGSRSGYCRMAFVDPNGRFYVVSAYGWDEPKTMVFDKGAWANAADTRHLRNIIAGKAEFDGE